MPFVALPEKKEIADNTAKITLSVDNTITLYIKGSNLILQKDKDINLNKIKTFLNELIKENKNNNIKVKFNPIVKSDLFYKDIKMIKIYSEEVYEEKNIQENKSRLKYFYDKLFNKGPTKETEMVLEGTNKYEVLTLKHNSKKYKDIEIQANLEFLKENQDNIKIIGKNDAKIDINNYIHEKTFSTKFNKRDFKTMYLIQEKIIEFIGEIKGNNETS